VVAAYDLAARAAKVKIVNPDRAMRTCMHQYARLVAGLVSIVARSSDILTSITLYPGRMCPGVPQRAGRSGEPSTIWVTFWYSNAGQIAHQRTSAPA
jgi:hypothetical protein